MIRRRPAPWPPSRPPASAPAPHPVNRARIASALRNSGFTIEVRDDGAVTGRWNGHDFALSVIEDPRVLHVVGSWGRTVPTSSIGSLLQVLNDWNRERVLPKVYARPQNGGMAVMAETNVDLAHGATDRQLIELLTAPLRLSTLFFQGLDASLLPALDEGESPS